MKRCLPVTCKLARRSTHSVAADPLRVRRRAAKLSATYEEAMARLMERIDEKYFRSKGLVERYRLKQKRYLEKLRVAATEGREASHGIPYEARFRPSGLPRSCYWGDRYVNPWKPYCCDHSPVEATFMALEGGLPRFQEHLSDSERDLLLPTVAVDWARLAEARARGPAAGTHAVWAGHASLLAVVDGVSMLTDPVFGERCSPVRWFGPRRYVPAPFDLETMPLPVDVVLLSHNHYDHLCPASLRTLSRRFDPLVLVPKGVKATVVGAGVDASRVAELDWWQQAALLRRPSGGVDLGAVSTAPEVEALDAGAASGAGDSNANAREKADLRCVFTPAQHWSARGPHDRNASLWGGFAALGEGGRFFFAGDTGYCPVFQQIGDALGPFDVAALPLGAYSPRWFMRDQHADPEQALLMHGELQARASLAMHWGTWPLAKDGPTDPLRDLNYAKKLHGKLDDPHALLPLRAGGAVHVATDGAVKVGGQIALDALGPGTRRAPPPPADG